MGAREGQIGGLEDGLTVATGFCRFKFYLEFTLSFRTRRSIALPHFLVLLHSQTRSLWRLPSANVRLTLCNVESPEGKRMVGAN